MHYAMYTVMQADCVIAVFIVVCSTHTKRTIHGPSYEMKTNVMVIVVATEERRHRVSDQQTCKKKTTTNTTNNKTRITFIFQSTHSVQPLNILIQT